MNDLAYLIKVSLCLYSGSSDGSLLSLENLRQKVWAKSHIVGYFLGGPSGHHVIWVTRWDLKRGQVKINFMNIFSNIL